MFYLSYNAVGEYGSGFLFREYTVECFPHAVTVEATETSKDTQQ
jgi:hypothetical protein